MDLLKDKNKKEDKNIDKQLELEKFVDRLCKVSVKISQARELCKEFIGIIRERKALDLDNWVSKAINSGIVALKNFASFLLKDLDAVRNALIFEWSNGKVEAQVNRLKTVKRQMYGRANLDLLKARLLSINL
ncbi:MAG: transposase [Acidobacteria bacterium]|nr:transposase [Acidobacteriota bacterium]